MFINDLKMVYKKAINETIKKIKSNPIILIIPAIYSIMIYLATLLLNGFVSGVSQFGAGFIMPVAYALILSSYYEILSDLNSFGKITFKNMKNTFTRNFAAIYSVFFIMTLINYIILPISGNLYPLVLVITFILFNPIAEAIYIRGENFTSAFSYSFNFMKENIIHWGLPLALYTVLIYIIGGFNSLVFVISNVSSIPVGINYGVVTIIKFIIIEIIAAIYAVNRSSLFNILSKSTMRKRAYMGEIN